MNLLNQYGWCNFQSTTSFTNATGLLVGRVISIHGFQYWLITERGQVQEELSGKLLYGAINEELPKVGDWVSFTDYETIGYIIEVLPRRNALSRKTPGEKTERQILAANVDGALIIQSLDRDFNLMRLERYIVQVTSCGIEALIVLNKADLIDDYALYQKQIESLQRNCRIFYCSAHNGKGMSELQTEALLPERTFILIGSSGVGKSSLLNALSNQDLQSTGAMSDANSKGKHTTTTRDLFQLPNGSLVIDTPGMREFGLTAENDQSTDSLFPAISTLATQCRFTDCEHLHESGCAVLEALANGQLEPLVYDSYVKLVKEQGRFSIKAEDKKRLGKQFGRMTREANNFRKKNKF